AASTTAPADAAAPPGDPVEAGCLPLLCRTEACRPWSLNPRERPHQCRRQRLAFTRCTTAERGNHTPNLPTGQCQSVKLARPPPGGPRSLPSRPFVEFHLSHRRDSRALLRTECGGFARDAQQRSQQEIGWLEVEAGERHQSAQIG